MGPSSIVGIFMTSTPLHTSTTSLSECSKPGHCCCYDCYSLARLALLVVAALAAARCTHTHTHTHSIHTHTHADTHTHQSTNTLVHVRSGVATLHDQTAATSWRRSSDSLPFFSIMFIGRSSRMALFAANERTVGFFFRSINTVLLVEATSWTHTGKLLHQDFSLAVCVR